MPTYKGERMDIKSTKLKIAFQVILILAFIGYFVALFKGNERNISTYSYTITIFAICNSSLFVKKKIDNKLLSIGVKTNGVLLIICIATVFYRLLVK